jgi:hypothetical protein
MFSAGLGPAQSVKGISSIISEGLGILFSTKGFTCAAGDKLKGISSKEMLVGRLGGGEVRRLKILNGLMLANMVRLEDG